MSRENLRRASERLRTASEDAGGDAGDRLGSLADRLASLADADRKPDHGTIARIQNSLREVREEVDAGVAEAIDATQDDLMAYRETVEGV